MGILRAALSIENYCNACLRIERDIAIQAMPTVIKMRIAALDTESTANVALDDEQENEQDIQESD